MDISTRRNTKLIIHINLKSGTPLRYFINKFDAAENNTTNLFASKYFFLYKNTGTVIDDVKIKKFADTIDKTYTSGLIYESISHTFVPDYLFCVDNFDHFISSKNILIFRDEINIDESLTHFFHKHNAHDVKINIYPVFLQNRPSHNEFEATSLALLTRYPASNILYHDTLNEPPFSKNYSQLRDDYKNQHIDTIICDFRSLKVATLDFYHFITVLISINVLVQGGKYIFRIHNNSDMYITQICTFLSKYFENIFVSRQKIRSTESAYVFCTNFSGTSMPSLDTVIESWEEPVSSLFEFENIDPNIVSNLTIIRNQINKSVAKKQATYESKIRFVEKLSLDEMLKHHSYNNKINMSLSVSVAHKYKLELRPGVAAKTKRINFTFDAPIHITLLRASASQPNDGTKLLLYKSTIDSMDPKKWQNVVEKMDITRLIPKKMGVSVTVCKMYEICRTFRISFDVTVACSAVYQELFTNCVANNADLLVCDHDDIDFDKVKSGGASIVRLTFPFKDLTQLYAHFENVSFYKPLVGSLIDEDIFLVMTKHLKKPLFREFDTGHVSDTIVNTQIAGLKILFETYNGLHNLNNTQSYLEDYYSKWSQYFNTKSFSIINGRR